MLSAGLGRYQGSPSPSPVYDIHWTGPRDTAGKRRVSSLETSEMCQKFSKMICLFHQAVTFRMCWCVLHLIVKWSKGRWALPNLRVWFSPRKGLLSPGWGETLHQACWCLVCDGQLGAVSSVMRVVYGTIVVKRGLHCNAKSSVYPSISYMFRPSPMVFE